MSKVAMKDGKYIALTHKLCPICSKKCDEQSKILLDMRFRDISELHNQAIGFGNPCKECSDGINMGAIMVIVLDSTRGSMTDINNWYRTGNIMGIKEEAAKKLISNAELLEDVLKKRIMVVDYPVAVAIGLPVKYNLETGTNK